MKVILNIGRQSWVCESAKVAAQISDLIGSCSPVEKLYEPAMSYRQELFVEGETDDHKLEIIQITKNITVTDKKSAIAIVAEARKQQEIEAEKKLAKKGGQP